MCFTLKAPFEFQILNGLYYTPKIVLPVCLLISFQMAWAIFQRPTNTAIVYTLWQTFLRGQCIASLHLQWGQTFKKPHLNLYIYPISRTILFNFVLMWVSMQIWNLNKKSFPIVKQIISNTVQKGFGSIVF